MVQRADWALLTISEAGGDGLSPVQLQKSLFLLGAKLPDAVGKDYYDFQPYNYGPYDGLVYADVETLAAQGFVRLVRVPGRAWAEYSATPTGLQRALELKALAPRNATVYLAQLVSWIRNMTFQQLLRAIYSMYPSYRQNSVFRD